jgi:hypothetical protein
MLARCLKFTRFCSAKHPLCVLAITELLLFLFRYKKLWDQDKDAYIRRYEKANKPLSSYELDIKEYLNKEVCIAAPPLCLCTLLAAGD